MSRLSTTKQISLSITLDSGQTETIDMGRTKKEQLENWRRFRELCDEAIASLSQTKPPKQAPFRNMNLPDRSLVCPVCRKKMKIDVRMHSSDKAICPSCGFWGWLPDK